MYFKWKEKKIAGFSDADINALYDQGYVFTRAGKGMMNQTRSLRIDLSNFTLGSENRRVMKKTEGLKVIKAPLPYERYHWSIGKLAKDFYKIKFGAGAFSANKIRELMTDEKKSNFNILFVYSDKTTVGYCIARETGELIHYCYPFYRLDAAIPNLGLGMMLRAVLYAQEQGKKYIYLGSFQRPTDTYKLQFAGLEWFDGQRWQTDLKKIKNQINYDK